MHRKRKTTQNLIFTKTVKQTFKKRINKPFHILKKALVVEIFFRIVSMSSFFFVHLKKQTRYLQLTLYRKYEHFQKTENVFVYSVLRFVTLFACIFFTCQSVCISVQYLSASSCIVAFCL